MKHKNHLQRDFLISDLPSTRKELFWDILKNQWGVFIGCAFFLLLAFLPFIIYRYENLLTINSIITDGKTQEELKLEIINYYRVYLLVNGLFFLFIGIILSGIMRIFKRLTYGEGVFLGADFAQGVKENIKEYIIVFIFYEIIYFLLETLGLYFQGSNNFLYYLLKMVHYGIIIPILFIVLCLSCTYTDSLIKKVRASLTIYLRFFPKILLLTMIGMAPLLLLLLPITYVQLFVPMLYVLLLLPFLLLAARLLINSFFDKLINNISFPDLVNKGLYKEIK